MPAGLGSEDPPPRKQKIGGEFGGMDRFKGLNLLLFPWTRADSWGPRVLAFQLLQDLVLRRVHHAHYPLHSFAFGCTGTGLAGDAGDASPIVRAIWVSITIAPPALPVYEQPPIPAPGYMWTPGYWAWDPDVQDYYWVPGTWVPAPQPGYLWTPGYWGWAGSRFIWYEGYWGPHIGFYGGVNLWIRLWRERL